MGFGAASVPMVCQLIVAFALLTAGDDFPKADHSLLGINFWGVQMMLVCVAVAGNTIIDFGKHMVEHKAGNLSFVGQFFALALSFVALSVFFAITLLDTELSLTFLLPVLTSGALALLFAYLVDMKIALVEAVGQ